MRQLSVFIFAFVFICVLLWGICAFVTVKPNPFDWTGEGRFAFVVFGLMFGFFGGLGAVVAYEESH